MSLLRCGTRAIDIPLRISSMELLSWRKKVQSEESPVEWCRRKQEECLDNNDEKGALVYYELTKMWMEREKKKKDE
jgi:hypothetical protein